MHLPRGGSVDEDRGLCVPSLKPELLAPLSVRGPLHARLAFDLNRKRETCAGTSDDFRTSLWSCP